MARRCWRSWTRERDIDFETLATFRKFAAQKQVEARDLLSYQCKKQQVLRFAQDDKQNLCHEICDSPDTLTRIYAKSQNRIHFDRVISSKRWTELPAVQSYQNL